MATRGTITMISRRGEPARSGAGPSPDVRERISQWFGRVEDVVYVGLGVVLAGSALVLLGAAAWGFGQDLLAGELPEKMIALLDRVLLIVMVVEVLYTVQVSFRERVLVPEPFLIVGLIAATRRILLLTAEFSKFIESGQGAFRNAMTELGLLTVLIVALVGSIVLLRKRHPEAVAERA
jgi:hypothetical protein